VKSANSVCFAMNGMLQSQRTANTPAESRDALARLVASMRHFKERFEKIEPPAADAKKYGELLRQMGFVVAGLERTRVAVAAAKPAAVAKAQDEFMLAAMKVDRLAGELGISQCATS
jgi:ParB-like chromosome segregation protein Spo0J